MRLRSYHLVGLLALLPVCGCNSNGNNGNAVGGEPHPTANELDKALERRPKVANEKNRDERKKNEAKTWIGRSILGVVSDGEGISSEENDKLRDYILANDEYLSQHMTPPKDLIQRANKRPEPMRLHDKPKSQDGKSGGTPKSPEKATTVPTQPSNSVLPLEKTATSPAISGEGDAFGVSP